MLEIGLTPMFVVVAVIPVVDCLAGCVCVCGCVVWGAKVEVDADEVVVGAEEQAQAQPMRSSCTASGFVDRPYDISLPYLYAPDLTTSFVNSVPGIISGSARPHAIHQSFSFAAPPSTPVSSILYATTDSRVRPSTSPTIRHKA